MISLASISNENADFLHSLTVFLFTQELQLHLGVLQQHAALIGGPNATSCLICHKLFLGAEALMEHMKHHHKQEPTPPVVSSCKFASLLVILSSI